MGETKTKTSSDLLLLVQAVARRPVTTLWVLYGLLWILALVSPLPEVGPLDMSALRSSLLAIWWALLLPVLLLAALGTRVRWLHWTHRLLPYPFSGGGAGAGRIIDKAVTGPDRARARSIAKLWPQHAGIVGLTVPIQDRRGEMVPVVPPLVSISPEPRGLSVVIQPLAGQTRAGYEAVTDALMTAWRGRVELAAFEPWSATFVLVLRDPLEGVQHTELGGWTE